MESSVKTTTNTCNRCITHIESKRTVIDFEKPKDNLFNYFNIVKYKELKKIK